MGGLVVAHPARSQRFARPRRLSPVARQLVTFGAIGVVSTVAYAALYAALRPFMDATIANAAALLATAVGNTAANRRLTFARRGSDGMVRDQAAGIAALVIALAITTSAVGILGLVAPTASRWTEIAVLVLANALATVSRFFLLRSWIAQPKPGSLPAARPPTA